MIFAGTSLGASAITSTVQALKTAAAKISTSPVVAKAAAATAAAPTPPPPPGPAPVIPHTEPPPPPTPPPPKGPDTISTDLLTAYKTPLFIGGAVLLAGVGYWYYRSRKRR